MGMVCLLSKNATALPVMQLPHKMHYFAIKEFFYVTPFLFQMQPKTSEVLFGSCHCAAVLMFLFLLTKRF
jgi:hypothetical protein